jgi:hypothetical protein
LQRTTREDDGLIQVKEQPERPQDSRLRVFIVGEKLVSEVVTRV